MTEAGKLVSAEAYRAVYDPLTGFEGICSLARQRRNLDFLRQHRPRRILEVGCGAQILARLPGAEALDFDLWAVVEPVADFLTAARAAVAGDGRFLIQEGYLESRAADLTAAVPQGFDAVLVSGLLHETSAPQALLSAAVGLCRPGGHVLASVPNALSFHRLLAVRAGLIPAPGALSDRDRALGHPVVFDRAGLTALMAGAGLTDLTFDGYLFKPLTHGQMEAVLAMTPSDLVDGLIALGRDFPDNAAEICVTGRRP